MTTDLDKISQITIYLKNSDQLTERVSEVALFNPLSKKASFDEENATVAQRKWTFHHHIPLSRRLLLNLQTFFFHKLKVFIPDRRKSLEAKFKTTLSILLSQESLREYFLSTDEKRKQFFQALTLGAQTIGYEFSPPDNTLSQLEIAREITRLQGHKKSLIEDLPELNLQMAALPVVERNEILFTILNNIERLPVASVVEIELQEHEALKIELITKYAKIQVHRIDEKSGYVDFTAQQNHTTSSIETKENIKKGTKGVMNQRMVLDGQKLIGSYCGELLTSHNVLEQLLFLFGAENASQIYLLPPPSGVVVEDKTVLFTSLFSWNEYGKILDEHNAIDDLHGKVLKIVGKDGSQSLLRLNLLHQNLSFNAFNKFPTPSETKANIKDINEEMLIQLLKRAWTILDLPKSEEIDSLASTIDEARKGRDFLKKQQQILNTLDRFKQLKSRILAILEPLDHEIALALKALLSMRTEEHKKLSQIDILIYTCVLTKHLGVIHNKNCEYATDRTDGANAADKAQHAFRKIRGHSFLPSLCTLDEVSLFKVLYSMYLVWEEPELNCGLSTGFVGEKFFHNFIAKNPETTKYLTHWLKHHPEMYLGLSDYRH